MSEYDELESIKYPIGKFTYPDGKSIEERISEIETLPALLRQAVENLDDKQLDTPYREDGWTVRQVVAHIGDSDMNAFVRIKLALTEDNPTVKNYSQEAWADLPDDKLTPVEPSLRLVEGIRARWTVILKNLKTDEWQRTFYNPEQQKSVTVERYVALYAWHGRHHLEQILGAKKRMGWK